MPERIIHIHPNKTGGTTIRKMLRIKHQPGHLRAVELRDYYHEYEDAFTFAVVRNPFDRMVSLYEYKRRKWQAANRHRQLYWGFDEWVRMCFVDDETETLGFTPRFLKPCTWWVQDDDGQIIVDKIIRFEPFDEAVNTLHKECQARGIPYSLTVPHLRRGRAREPYQSYYKDERTLVAVRNWFISDIEVFNYGF